MQTAFFSTAPRFSFFNYSFVPSRGGAVEVRRGLTISPVEAAHTGFFNLHAYSLVPGRGGGGAAEVRRGLRISPAEMRASLVVARVCV